MCDIKEGMDVTHIAQYRVNVEPFERGDKS
jgi:hypothetical protein